MYNVRIFHMKHSCFISESCIYYIHSTIYMWAQQYTMLMQNVHCTYISYKTFIFQLINLEDWEMVTDFSLLTPMYMEVYLRLHASMSWGEHFRTSYVITPKSKISSRMFLNYLDIKATTWHHVLEIEIRMILSGLSKRKIWY